MLKFSIGLVFAIAVVAYVHNPAQAKALSAIIVEMMFGIGHAVREAGTAVIHLL